MGLDRKASQLTLFSLTTPIPRVWNILDTYNSTKDAKVIILLLKVCVCPQSLHLTISPTSYWPANFNATKSMFSQPPTAKLLSRSGRSENPTSLHLCYLTIVCPIYKT